MNGKRTSTRTSRMHFGGLGNLCSSVVYNQGQLTLIFNTISCGLQSKAANNRVNSAGTQSTSGKSKRERCESAKTNFTNDDVTKYVIGGLQCKLPRAPLPFNPTLIVNTKTEKSWNYFQKQTFNQQFAALQKAPPGAQKPPCYATGRMFNFDLSHHDM